MSRPVRGVVVLVIEPAEKQQKEVEGSGVHVLVRDVLESCHPFEPLLANDRVVLLYLLVLVRVAEFAAILTLVALKVPLLDCVHVRRTTEPPMRISDTVTIFDVYI